MKRAIEALALAAVVLLEDCAQGSGTSAAATPSHVPGLDLGQALRLSSLPPSADGASLLAEGSGTWGYYLIHVAASGVVVYQEGRTGDYFPRYDEKPILNPYPALHWPPEAWQPTASFALRTAISLPTATKLIGDVNALVGVKDLGVDCSKPSCPTCVRAEPGAGGQTPGAPPLVILLFRGHHTGPIACDTRAAAVVSDVDDLLRELNVALPTPAPTGR